MLAGLLEHPDITRANERGYCFDEKIVAECECCGDEIYEGNKIYNLPGFGMIHHDCLSDYFYQYGSIAGGE